MSATPHQYLYDVQFPSNTEVPQAEQDEVMASLSSSLEGLLSLNDDKATVTDTESHKGEGHRLLDVSTTLDDEQMATAIKALAKQTGLAVNPQETAADAQEKLVESTPAE